MVSIRTRGWPRSTLQGPSGLRLRRLYQPLMLDSGADRGELSTTYFSVLTAPYSCLAQKSARPKRTDTSCHPARPSAARQVQWVVALGAAQEDPSPDGSNSHYSSTHTPARHPPSHSARPNLSYSIPETRALATPSGPSWPPRDSEQGTACPSSPGTPDGPQTDAG